MSSFTISYQPRAFHMLMSKDKAPVSPVMLYPVLNAEELLLADPKRRHFLNQISQYTGLETPLYQTLYETAIVRFAELAQALPYQAGSAPGSLMDYSLEHAVTAIRHYHESAGHDFRQSEGSLFPGQYQRRQDRQRQGGAQGRDGV